MRYPEFLKNGGTIGFAAPSFGCAIEPYKTRLDAAVKTFGNLGYRTLLGPNAYADEGVGISNTPEKCAGELNDMYLGSDADVILSVGGGELMCETVPFIDFDAIGRSEPKWFMGYSDNTNFTFLSATLADTAAVYGPCAPAFGREPWHESITDALELLKGNRPALRGYPAWEKDDKEAEPTAPYNVTEPTVYRLFGGENGEVRMRGRLLGGCMDILYVLLGTRFDRVADFCERYREDGMIWFLEACDQTVLDIRRILWSMREAGWFKYAKGFIFGRPLCFGERLLGVDQYSAVTEPLKGLGVPIIMDADIGHLPPMLPLITGAVAEIGAAERSLRLKYELI